MALVRIKASAWIKMQALVIGHDKEVGWFGTVEKLGTGDYRIKDILIYPQLVSSAYVEDTIDEGLDEMIEWRNNLTDDEYNSRRFHGHSHVNMSVCPSSTDEESWKRFAISNSTEGIQNRFTITTIINKKMEMMWWILDAEDKLEYKNTDIEILIEVEDGISNSQYYEESRKMVRDIPSFKSSTYFLFGGGEKKQTLPGKYFFSKKETEKKKTYPLADYYDNFYGNDEFDWSSWYEGYSSLDDKTEDFTPSKYSISFNFKESTITKVYAIHEKFFDVVCTDYFGNEYAMKTVSAPKSNDPLAAANSVAMSIYDYFLDKKYDYFKVVDKNGALIDMSTFDSVNTVMSLAVKSVDVKTDKDNKEMILVTLEAEAKED